MKKTSGFTLIELLVVIAIIAILAAILFPVFITVKERGHQAACLSNLRQIGSADILYAQNWNDTMAWGMFINQSGTRDNIPTLLHPYTKSWKVWRCPSVPSTVTADENGLYNGAQGGPTYINLPRHYGYNINVHPQLDYSQGVFYPVRIRKLSDIRRVTATASFLDSQNYPVVDWADFTYTVKVKRLGWMYKTHMNGINVSFCDGHARWCSFTSIDKTLFWGANTGPDWL